MNALDSPLEALAFNYVSYGLLTVVNNMWTWVAVLTAAVSFWRIRASSEHPRGKVIDESSQSLIISSSPISFWRIRGSSEHPRGKFIDGSSQGLLLSLPHVEEVEVGEQAELPGQDKSISSPARFCGWDREGSTKGKLTMYYYNEEESEKCETFGNHKGGLVVDGNDNNVGEKVGEGWWSKWEMVMKMRKGDDEWYSYQDMKFINGNVVRLWDGCTQRRNEATPLELVVGGGGDLMLW